MEARRLCLHKGTHEGLEKSGRGVEEKWRQKRRAITCFSIAYADFVEDVGKNKTIGGMRAHARGAADGGREKEASGKKRGRLFQKNNKKPGKAGIKWEKWYIGKWKEGVPHAKGQKNDTAPREDAMRWKGKELWDISAPRFHRQRGSLACPWPLGASRGWSAREWRAL